MEAHHNEGLRKQKAVERKRERHKQRKLQEVKGKHRNSVATEFAQNPGAGPLLGCTTIYMDGYQRARCSSAKLTNRYNSTSYLQQY